MSWTALPGRQSELCVGEGKFCSGGGLACSNAVHADMKQEWEVALFDFSVDPEFQAKLDWMLEFVIEQCEPLDRIPVQRRRSMR